MNKDELINKILACFKMTVDVKGLDQLEKYISDIEEENKKYKEVIDKLNNYLNQGYLINTKEMKKILKEAK